MDDVTENKATPNPWAETVRGLGVALCAVAIAWRRPDSTDWAYGVLSLIASPALARAFLDRFKR